MALSVGTRLGPYEILAPIGAGGMGEVYRARDPRMGREVAIKVSAERISDRFEREVHAVARRLGRLQITRLWQGSGVYDSHERGLRNRDGDDIRALLSNWDRPAPVHGEPKNGACLACPLTWDSVF